MLYSTVFIKSGSSDESKTGPATYNDVNCEWICTYIARNIETLFNLDPVFFWKKLLYLNFIIFKIIGNHNYCNGPHNVCKRHYKQHHTGL